MFKNKTPEKSENHLDLDNNNFSEYSFISISEKKNEKNKSIFDKEFPIEINSEEFCEVDDKVKNTHRNILLRKNNFKLINELKKNSNFK